MVGFLLSRYELAREKEREEQDALRKDEDQRKTIIQEERRRHQGVRQVVSFAFAALRTQVVLKIAKTSCLDLENTHAIK